MYKKKEKKKSPVTDWLAKQREKEWEEAMGKRIRSLYPTLEEREEMKRLLKKYGIKEKN